MLLGFIVGRPARAARAKRVAERRRAVLAEFVRFFGPRMGDLVVE